VGELLRSEKLRQASFKATSPYFSKAARDHGVYRGKVRLSVCLSNAPKKMFFLEFVKALQRILSLNTLSGTTGKTASLAIIFTILRSVA
jgi:hypothetical protein